MRIGLEGRVGGAAAGWAADAPAAAAQSSHDIAIAPNARRLPGLPFQDGGQGVASGVRIIGVFLHRRSVGSQRLPRCRPCRPTTVDV
jgi:hypothetical protein